VRRKAHHFPSILFCFVFLNIYDIFSSESLIHSLHLFSLYTLGINPYTIHAGDSLTYIIVLKSCLPMDQVALLWPSICLHLDMN